MVPKENHVGKFPANFCIKMVGTSGKLIYITSKLSQLWQKLALLLLERTGSTLVVRTCSLEDMNSQCGTFRFQNDTLKGCILTCNYDGCNSCNGNSLNLALFTLLCGIYLLV